MIEPRNGCIFFYKWGLEILTLYIDYYVCCEDVIPTDCTGIVRTSSRQHMKHWRKA